MDSEKIRGTHGATDIAIIVSIVNALIVAIASRRKRELEKKFSELETVWEKYNVYEKQVDL